MATCSLSTTYVEVQYKCDGQSCAPSAVRRSTLPRDYPAALYQLNGVAGPSTDVDIFCEMFINSTGPQQCATLFPLEFHLIDSDFPYRTVTGKRPLVADVGSALFSLRFAQLLDTYRMALIAAYAVTGNFSSEGERRSVNRGLGNTYEVSNTTSLLETGETILICHKSWLAILIVSSLVIAAAGLATVVLNLTRKGPEILDSFTSMLWDSPYILVGTGSSREDGPDKVRRLRKTKVILEDVQPKETYDYIALATKEAGQHVERLRTDRSYF